MNFLIFIAIKIAAALAIILTAVPLLVWMERKVSASFQRRIGPNRVGPWGIFQSIADAVKLFFKEKFIPTGADPFIFLAAPVLMFLPGVISFALIPMGEYEMNGERLILSVADIDLGLIIIMAISSLSSYGIAYAGWASSNQYALLGGIRSCAQLISYEIVMVLSVIAVVMMSGTLDLAQIVRLQMQPLPALGFLPAWNVFHQPLTFLLFLIASFAETNRAPFDLPEAEQELVGGYHTEYTGIRYAWFMLGEYAGLFTMSSLVVTLFFGGWSFPGIEYLTGPVFAVAGFVIFITKVILLIFFYMWVRWTLPRFRWDQLMHLGWHRLIPFGLFNVFLTAYLCLR